MTNSIAINAAKNSNKKPFIGQSTPLTHPTRMIASNVSARFEEWYGDIQEMVGPSFYGTFFPMAKQVGRYLKASVVSIISPM